MQPSAVRARVSMDLLFFSSFDHHWLKCTGVERSVLGKLESRNAFNRDISANKIIYLWMQYNGGIFYFIFRNGPIFFLFADVQPFPATKHNLIFGAVYSIWVHCLANSVWHRSCCYGDVKCSRSHYLRDRSLRKRSMYLVINQAVADMFVGCSVINLCWSLGNLCDFLEINYFGIAFSVLIVAFDFFFALASLLNLSAISLDRKHATFRAFKHRLVKKNIFGAVIAAVWITAGVFTSSIVLPFLEKFSTFKFMNTFLSYLSFFLFCLLIILVSYLSIAIKIVWGSHPHYHSATNRERKLTKTLFIVTVVSLLLTLPYVILQILYLVSLHTGVTLSFQARFRLNLSALLLFDANSFVNPVLYTFRMPEFERALFAFLSCRSQPQPAQAFPLNEM